MPGPVGVSGQGFAPTLCLVFTSSHDSCNSDLLHQSPCPILSRPHAGLSLEQKLSEKTCGQRGSLLSVNLRCGVSLAPRRPVSAQGQGLKVEKTFSPSSLHSRA